MAKDLYRALRCFLIEFQDLKTYYASNNYTAMSLLANIPGDGQPWCAHMMHDTRLCQVRAQAPSSSGSSAGVQTCALHGSVTAAAAQDVCSCCFRTRVHGLVKRQPETTFVI
jgi:hypothetical protein